MLNATKHIVILDPTPTNRAVLSAHLKRQGYCVAAYAKPKDALEVLLPSTNPLPDLLIIELDLPFIDGLSVIKAVRKRSESLPILVVTVRDRILDRVFARLAGANAYLTKPYRIQSISFHVQVLLPNCRIFAY